MIDDTKPATNETTDEPSGEAPPARQGPENISVLESVVPAPSIVEDPDDESETADSVPD